MRIQHLSLVNFRNYSRLELDMPPGVVLLLGDNAQGKTNLLEAIFVLSRMRSSRTSTERELVNWLTLEDDLPFARLAAQVQKGGETEQVEVSLVQNGLSLPEGNGSSLRKHIRINGANKRALEAVGFLSAVLFMPQDIDLVSGSPGGRRRYIDDTLCQVDPQYVRELQHYTRVLTERNFLLRSLRNRSYDPSELAFWDQRLVEHGSYLIWKRRRVLEQMSGEARLIHLGLTGEMDSLQLEYVSTVSGGNAPSYQLELPASAGEETQADRTDVQSAVSGAFTARLREMRGRELEQGMTLVGPHRDDLRFWVNRVDMNIYGSRGQQRTVALSLKLAEMELVAKIKGERPVLLLDDVISELDEAHRGHLLRALDTVQQVVMTATDLAHFSPDFVAKATLWRVSGGRIENEAIQP
jgi:DNA replication and repair protein RecF